MFCSLVCMTATTQQVAVSPAHGSVNLHSLHEALCPFFSRIGNTPKYLHDQTQQFSLLILTPYYLSYRSVQYSNVSYIQ